MFKLIKHGEIDWLFERDSFFYSSWDNRACRPVNSMIGKKHQLQWEMLGRDAALEKMREYFLPLTISSTEGISRIVYQARGDLLFTRNGKEIPQPIKLWAYPDEDVVQKIVDRHFGDDDDWVKRYAPRTKHLAWEDLAYPTASYVSFGNGDYPATVSYGRTPFMVGAAAMGKTEAAFVLHDHQKALLVHAGILASRSRKINNHSTFGSFLKPRNQGKSTDLNPLEYARQMSNLMSFSALSTLREREVMDNLTRVLDMEDRLLFGRQ